MQNKNSKEAPLKQGQQTLSLLLEHSQKPIRNTFERLYPYVFLNEQKELCLKEKLHQFPLKPGVTQMCTKYFTNNSEEHKQVCYNCLTCKRLDDRDRGDQTYIICEGCFRVEQHQNHYYQVLTPSLGFYCQCGKDLGDDCDSEPFSCGHAHSLMPIETQKTEAEKQEEAQISKQFVYHFKNLLGFWKNSLNFSALQKYRALLNQRICSELSQICSGSPFYINLMSQLLFSPFQEDSQDNSTSWFQVLIQQKFIQPQNTPSQQLILSLCSQNSFSLKLSKEMVKFPRTKNWYSIPLLTQLHHKSQNIIAFADSKFFQSQVQTQYIDACLRLNNDEIIFHHIKESYKSPKHFIQSVFTLMIKEDRPWFMSERSIKEFLPRILRILKVVIQRNEQSDEDEEVLQASQQQEQQNEEGQNNRNGNASAENEENVEKEKKGKNRQQNGNENEQNQGNPEQDKEKQHFFQNFIEVLQKQSEGNSKSIEPEEEGEYPDQLQLTQLVETVKMICFLLKWDPKRIAKASKQLHKVSISPKYFRSYLRPCLQNISNFPGLEQFIQILFLLETPKIREQFLAAIEDLDFQDFFPLALIIIKVIANYDFFFGEKQYESLDPKTKKQKKKENDQKRKRMFKQILVNNKTISFGFYLANKKKWLKTDLQSVMKQVGTVDKQNQRLQYNGKGEKQNPLRRLFLHHRGNDYYKKLTPKGSRFQINEEQKFLISTMIKKFPLSQLLKKKYNSLVKEVQGNEYKTNKFKELEYSQHYIQWLIWIDSFTEGTDKLAKEELELLCKDPDYRFSFEYLGNKDTIERLLDLQLENKEEQQQADAKKEDEGEEKQNGEQEKGKINQKFQDKKKKLQEKFKKKRQAFFDNLTSNSLRTFSMGEGEEECIICREKQKKEKPVGYLVEVVKKKTISSVFFSQNNKTETFIKSCFHTVHAECYHKSIRKASGRCPLCSKNSNGLIPMRFDKGQEKFNRICFTTISSAMIDAYDVLDIHSLFWIFFEHLIESRGLDSLMRPDVYEERRRRKERLDVFLEDMAINIYSTASSEQKKSYDEMIEMLKKQVLKCQVQTIQLLQLVLIEALENKIKNLNVEFDQVKLKKLEEMLIQQDFRIIKNQLEDMGADEAYCTNFAGEPSNAQACAPLQKTKLSYGFPKLPQSAHEIQKFVGEHCVNCHSKIREIKCLLCLKPFCSKCWRDTDHIHKHPWRLFFNVAFGQMQGRTNSKNIDVYLYRNELNAPLREISYPLTHKDTFKLDHEIVREIQKAFYEED